MMCVCIVCFACYTERARVGPSALVPALRCHFLENSHTHQKPLVFTLTSWPSTERLSLVELAHCPRQCSGIFTNWLRHCAICVGHLLLALLLIYVLSSQLKSKTSHPRLHTVSYVPPQVNKLAGEKVMWTDALAVVIKMSDDVTLLFADGCGTDVRCRACGGCGGAAIAADHCQLSAVQSPQALALRGAFHQPHQRGRRPSARTLS